MKKQTLAQDALKLYVEDFMTLNEIAQQRHINERTVRRWKKTDNWENQRAEYLRSKTPLHEDLYNFARKLIASIEKDMENNQKIEPAKFYTVSKMLKIINVAKDYEDENAKEKHLAEKEKPKKLTPDIIREIEEKFFGITYDNNFEHDLNTD